MKTELEKAAEKFLIRQGCQRMDCGEENCDLFEDVEPKDLIEFTKWQQERMYSDEEVKKIAFNFYYDMSHKMGVSENLISENATNVDDWFEQNKKK